MKIGTFDVTRSYQDILGVKFDHKLSFDDHISELCKKVSRKIHELSRVASYMNISKRCILMNALYKSKFSYSPLAWMCRSRANNHCVKSVKIWSFFWSVFSCIRTEYKDLRSKIPYSVRIKRIRTRKNSVFGRFSLSEWQNKWTTRALLANNIFRQTVIV